MGRAVRGFWAGLLMASLLLLISARSNGATTFIDDFSGGINPYHWTVNPGAYTVDDTHGDVRLSKLEGVGAWGSVVFNHTVYGDFDVSVDYRDAVLPANNWNQIQLNLVFGGQYVANRREYAGGQRYSVWLDPSGSSEGGYETGDLFGTLRVTRSGSLVTFYANANQIFQRDLNNYPVTQLSLSLQNNNTSDALSVTFDNFSITADHIDIPCVPPFSGLVAWWGGENNALDIVGANEASLQGGATYGAGKVGQAFSFDGDGDYVSINNTPSMDFGNGDFTVGLWVKLNSLANDQVFIQKYVGDLLAPANGKGFLMQFVPPNSLRFLVSDTSANINDIIVSVAPSLNTGQWYHVAGVRSGNNSKLFLDGSLIAEQDAGNNMDTGTGGTAYLGNMVPILPGDTRFLNGYLDEVELFSCALTASEIAAIYNAGSAGNCRPCTPPPADMISWWKGEDNAADNFGVNHGNLDGATFADGRVDRAFSLDGVDDYVVIPNGIITATARSFSLDAWVYANSLDGNEHVVVYGGAAAGEYLLMIDSNNNFRFGIKLDDGNWYTATSPAVANAWVHLAGVRRGATIELWVDGGLAASSGVPNRDLHSTGNNMNNSRLGAYNEMTDQHKSHWNGLIDEVTIFGRALAGDEIAVAYSAGGLGRCFTAQTTPQTFAFRAATAADPGTPIASNIIEVAGINSPAPIAIAFCTGSSCQYRINSGDWQADAGMVLNGDQVTVRQISSSAFNVRTDLTLEIGGVSSTFSVTTRDQAADLSLIKTSTPATPVLGQPLIYTLTVANAGPDTAEGVRVTDVLPAGLTFNSASAPCSYENADRTVTCSLGSLSSGADQSVDIGVLPSVSGPVSNTATVTSSILDPGGANNSSTREVTVEMHLFLPLIIRL